jgi:hypothetical protein
MTVYRTSVPVLTIPLSTVPVPILNPDVTDPVGLEPYWSGLDPEV